jgi:hypothetical protein
MVPAQNRLIASRLARLLPSEALTKTTSNSSQQVHLFRCLPESCNLIRQIVEPKLTCLSEHFLCRAEAICFLGPNRQPDHTKEEVHKKKRDGEFEDGRVHPRRQIIDRNRDNKQYFRYGPDESPPFDIIVSDTPRKVNFPYSQ